MTGDYGKNKIKTMERSLLPSTARKKAKKAKDRLHRQNRRRYRDSVATYRGPADYVIDIYDDDNVDHHYYVEPHSIPYWEDIVSERRQYDKTAPFEIWAYHRTKHLRFEDRLSSIRGILPKNTIGLHALTHLRFIDTEEINDSYYRRYPERIGVPDRLIRLENRKSPYFTDMAEINGRIWDALDTIHRNDKLRRLFNNYLHNSVGETTENRAHVRGWELVSTSVLYKGETFERVINTYREIDRTMNGYHDIHKFYRDVKSWPALRRRVMKYFGIE